MCVMVGLGWVGGSCEGMCLLIACLGGGIDG